MKSKLSKTLFLSLAGILALFPVTSEAQETPEVLTAKKATDENYLPDFSYAGYHFGDEAIPQKTGKTVLATEYGVVADDDLDDSKALLEALAATKTMDGPVTLQLPQGRLILSEILYLERSNFVLRGAGSGAAGTEIYCPRPMMNLEDPWTYNKKVDY